MEIMGIVPNGFVENAANYLRLCICRMGAVAPPALRIRFCNQVALEERAHHGFPGNGGTCSRFSTPSHDGGQCARPSKDQDNAGRTTPRSCATSLAARSPVSIAPFMNPWKSIEVCSPQK